jgi:hypothetical protein
MVWYDPRTWFSKEPQSLPSDMSTTTTPTATSVNPYGGKKTRKAKKGGKKSKKAGKTKKH